MRAIIRNFAFGLSHELIWKSKVALLNKDIDVSRLEVYIQQVKEKDKKQQNMGKGRVRNFDIQIRGKVNSRVVEIVRIGLRRSTVTRVPIGWLVLFI